MFTAKATRTVNFATLSGHAFALQAGQTYEFPDVVMTDAVMNGCIPVEEPAAPTPEPEKTPIPLDLQPNLVEGEGATARRVAICNAVTEVLARQDKRMLNRKGVPSVVLIRETMGDDSVTVEEVAEAVSDITARFSG